MGEDVIYSRMYSGQEGWWNSNIPRSNCFNGSAVMSASISCSTEFTDMGGGFNWAALAADSQSSSDESPGSAVSNNSLSSFQDTYHTAATAQMMDLAALSSPAADWNQKPLLSRESGYHALFQEGNKSSSSLRGDDDLQLLNPNQKNNMCDEISISSVSSLSHSCIDQGLPQYQHHYESLLRSLLEPEILLEPYYTQAPLPLEPSPPKQQPVLQFSTDINTSSANRPATTPINKDLRRLSSPRNNVVVSAPALKEINLNRSNRATKSVSEEGAGGLSADIAAQQPALKKPRIETPSPLPTFKVRKEKMGDRITALQQLVSPFGKTDTASVLTEAIEYIKFLHDQVGVLTAPYLNNGNQQMLHLKSLEKLNGTQGPKRDLGSRGLCLMPVASTYAVASEIPFDLWAPTFGGGSSFN